MKVVLTVKKKRETSVTRKVVSENILCFVFGRFRHSMQTEKAERR